MIPVTKKPTNRTKIIKEIFAFGRKRVVPMTDDIPTPVTNPIYFHMFSSTKVYSIN